MSDPVAERMRALVGDALIDLGSLRLDDPAAAHARHTIRLTCRTLECFWLPALDGIEEQRYDDV